MYYGFKEASSNRVIVGEDGWLFYNETISDYKRENLYTKAQLNSISKHLEEVQRYLNSLNINFVLFIAPNKCSIYGEYLPKFIKVQEKMSRTEQLVEYLKENTGITVVFPEIELLEMKERYPDYPSYMHLDTHWNNLGGYYGAKVLLDELGIYIPDIEKIDLEKNAEPVFYWQGYDLVKIMGMSGVLEEDINFGINGYSESIVEWYGNPRKSEEDFVGICRTFSNAFDKRKVVFVRDSFGTSMLPVIAACFEEMYSPHESYCSREKINLMEEQPDIVIYEMVERGDLETKNLLNLFERL